MIAFLQTVLNIVVFLLCLSIVVCIHEAGHLAVAKICNIYCFEYSIGFGPLLFKHKFKHKKKAKDGEVFNADEKEEGETQFSIRALPLGGYVAMAGEDSNLDEQGVVIPPERCLNNANHFKQICVMLAGITMNFLLALVLFFFSNVAPQTRSLTNETAIVVSEDSVASKVLQTNDKIVRIYQVYDNVFDNDGNKVDSLVFPAFDQQYDMVAYQKAKNSSITSISTYDDMTICCISYCAQDVFTSIQNNLLTVAHTDYYDGWENYHIGATTTRTFHITYTRGENTYTAVTDPIEAVKGDTTTDENGKEVTSFTMGLLGISCTTETFNYGFGESVVRSFQEFGSLFTGLYKALGSIFTPSGWKNVGGIISVYKMSAEGTTSGSISYFLLLWGYISLNLGCFNLLPFPGLDGWQTLMALIEACIRKKLPPKFKNVANSIGLIIMLILAGILVIKDIVVML